MKHFGLSEAERRHHPARPRRAAGRRRCRANIRCGGEVRKLILPTLEDLGIGFVPFSPLGAGFLTGADRRQHQDSAARFPAVVPRSAPEAMKANLALVDLARSVAQRKGATRRRSRSPGCSPESPGSSRFPAPRARAARDVRSPLPLLVDI